MKKVEILKNVVLDLGDGLGSSKRTPGQVLEFASDEFFEKGNYAERLAKLPNHIKLIEEDDLEIPTENTLEDEQPDLDIADETIAEEPEDILEEEDIYLEDLETYDLVQLKEFAKNNDIKFSKNATKDTMMELLTPLFEEDED